MYLLDILLPLMNEQQLRRHDHPSIHLRDLLGRSFLLIRFDREIPEGDGVVGGTGDEEGGIGGVPFDGGYGFFVPVEVGDGGWGCATKKGSLSIAYVCKLP